MIFTKRKFLSSENKITDGQMALTWPDGQMAFAVIIMV